MGVMFAVAEQDVVGGEPLALGEGHIYKYNRQIEHDRCRKRSTGTTNTVGKKETYLNRENSPCFHCDNKSWIDVE